MTRAQPFWVEPAHLRGEGVQPAPREPVQLLWTSGWDSTFRLLVALLVEGRTVQPYYVVDLSRPSYPTELRTMSKIRAALQARLADDAQLRPTNITVLSDLPTADRHAARFEALKRDGDLGPQYEWLARYAATLGLDSLELCIHKDDRAVPYVQDSLEVVSEQPFRSYRLAPDQRMGDLRLFQRFVFPILDLTKRDMQAAAERYGFLDLMEMTWFCHTPVMGRPCGLCNPCRDAVAEGMGHRVPASAHRRRRVHDAVPLARLKPAVKRLLSMA